MAVIEMITKLCILLPALAALATSVIASFKAHKAKKVAKTEAEKAAAINDMRDAVDGFITAAEEAYLAFDPILKQTAGKTSGNVKKKTVMTDLQAYALAKGYEFDADFWSKKIDDIVALTRVVNGKK